MEINTEIITTPPHPAATVVMLRDAADGLEVFLLKRHFLSNVLGGAYVFPGGKVDPQDAKLDADTRLDQSHSTLHASLNEPELDASAAAGLYVAAIREAFEESGVLFAHGATRQHAEQARALLRAGHAFDEMLAQLALRLQTHGVVPWSRWITPTLSTVSNKRFDTRFFLSALPSDQVARHDDHETTESIWLTPRGALQRYWAGEIALAPPQIMSLAHLTHFDHVDDALKAARARKPPVVAPEPFTDDGVRNVCYPGDERHSVRQRALPGPTRLSYRNQRFEPPDGFDALFDPGPRDYEE